MPNTPTSSEDDKTLTILGVSIKGLNKDDYHIILYDERFVRHGDMVNMAKHMGKLGYRFSLIPVATDPSKAIYLAGSDSPDPDLRTKNPNKVVIPKPKPGPKPGPRKE